MAFEVEDVVEFYNERAGVAQYDQGMSRIEAEAYAARRVGEKFGSDAEAYVRGMR